MVALGILPALGSAAGPSWSPTAEIASGGGTPLCTCPGRGCHSVDVATAPDGTTTAVWLEVPPADTTGRIRVATRAPGAAAFGPAVDVGSPFTLFQSPSNSEAGPYPSLAVAGS